MGSPHKHFADAYVAKRAKATKVAAPAAGGTIKLEGVDDAYVVLSATGTYTVDNAPTNSQLTVFVDDTSVITLKDVATNTIAYFTGATNANGVHLRASSTSSWVATSLGRSAAATVVAGIPVTAWREVSSGAVGAITANGGLLASDTTPTVTPVNGATDPTQIITWASSNNDVLLAHVPVPANADLRLGSPATFYCTIKSGGTTNAVGFTVSVFTDQGQELCNAATTTNQTTAYANKSVAIDLSGGDYSGTNFLTVMVTPAAHTTDTMVLKNAWIVFDRLATV